jgi:hypothetical protein
VVFEDGIRKLRLSGWGIGTVEYLSWHCELWGMKSTGKKEVVGVMRLEYAPNRETLYRHRGAVG